MNKNEGSDDSFMGKGIDVAMAVFVRETIETHDESRLNKISAFFRNTRCSSSSGFGHWVSPTGDRAERAGGDHDSHGHPRSVVAPYKHAKLLSRERQRTTDRGVDPVYIYATAPCLSAY